MKISLFQTEGILTKLRLSKRYNHVNVKKRDLTWESTTLSLLDIDVQKGVADGNIQRRVTLKKAQIRSARCSLFKRCNWCKHLKEVIIKK